MHLGMFTECKITVTNGCVFLLYELPLNSLPYVCHPGVPLLLASGVDLVHLWLIGGGADEKHGFLLMGHFPDNQFLKGDHRWLVILNGQVKGKKGFWLTVLDIKQF